MCNFSQSSLICRHCRLIFSINVKTVALFVRASCPAWHSNSLNQWHGFGAGLSVCLTNGESGNLGLYYRIIQTQNHILSVYRVFAVFMKVKLKFFRNFFRLPTDHTAKKKFFRLTQYKCLKIHKSIRYI